MWSTMTLTAVSSCSLPHAMRAFEISSNSSFTSPDHFAKISSQSLSFLKLKNKSPGLLPVTLPLRKLSQASEPCSGISCNFWSESEYMLRVCMYKKVLGRFGRMDRSYSLHVPSVPNPKRKRRPPPTEHNRHEAFVYQCYVCHADVYFMPGHELQCAQPSRIVRKTTSSSKRQVSAR